MNKKVRSGAVRCKHVALAVTAAFLPSGQSYALPTGEAVVAGDVTVTRPTAQTMQINQATQKGIVNWLGFSIGASEHVNVTQPSASASLLNRVVGNNPSEIFGRLTANGRVFLVNPNGVLFAPGASVDVGSLFASSLALADQDFLAGRYQFSRQGSAGSVVNQGSIITANGYTALIGPQVRNDGVIIARSGAVALAAGDRVSLDMVGDGLISVSVDQAALNASVVNTGRIEADGGLVVLAARSANALLDTVINTSGIVRANALVERNGEIVLQGGDAGVVAVSGSLQAAGGTIDLSGDKIGVLDGARIDVSADTGGGTVHTSAAALYVAPNASISADALQSGNGGRVILWSSDSTQIHGAVSALGAGEGAGGFVETSGGFLDVTRAPDVGAGGTWLIDPYNITVVNLVVPPANNSGAPSFTPTGNDSQVEAGMISSRLQSGANVRLDTTGDGLGAQPGNITVNAQITALGTGVGTLTFDADNNVAINADISSGAFNVIAGGNMSVNAFVTTGSNLFAGPQNLNIAGALSVVGNAGAPALLIANGGQSITARSIDIRSQGAQAQISNQTSGNQTVNVTGGSIDVQTLAPGGNAAFANVAAGGAQTITVQNGDHLNVKGNVGGATASISSVGAQAISVTGNATNNKIEVGSSGALGGSFIFSSGNQQITAGTGSQAGSITLIGSNGPASGVTIQTNPSAGGASTQTLSTSGTLSVLGGNSPTQNLVGSPPALTSSNAGIFGNQTGTQTINAKNIAVQGGSGVNNGAFINATFGGNQTLTVPGEIKLTGGAGGSGNRAGIVTNASQTITGNPAIVLTGGGGGVAGNGNNVFIQSNFVESPGGETKPQTINARSIQLTSGAGIDASATLNAARQVITTTGNVSLFGGAGLGGSNGVRIGGIGGTTLGPTNLTLSVGGDLLLHAGTANGATLGSSGASTQANTIAVTAGNVTLESDGAGARIGSSGQVAVTPGNISAAAAGNLQLGEGTAIRANGPITLTATSLVNDGTITNGGGSDNMLLSANSYDLAGGTVQGGSAAVLLRPRDGTRSFGIEAAGDPTLTNHTNVTNADLASISTSNFIVFGSGMGTNFTGNMTIGQDAQVNGGANNLAFFRSATADGTTTIGANGVSTGGNLIVSAGGGSMASNGGVVSGNQVQLRAARGIGSAASRVLTSANRLAINTPGTQGVFVTELGHVTLGDVNLRVGTIDNNIGNFAGGAFDLTTQGGDLTVVGAVTSGSMTIDAGGALTVAASGVQDAILSSSGGQTITAQSVSVTAHDGRLGQIVNNVSGEQTITTGALSVSGGSALTYPTLSGVVQNAGDAQTINASSVQVQGTDVGVNNGIFIRAATGDQTLTVTGDISIAAGAGGEAWIQGSRDGLQKIYAHNITMKNAGADDLVSPGGTNSFAALQGGHQEIHASGDVLLKAGRTAGTLGGARMGGLRNPLDVTATDLKLYVTGNLTLQGGTVADNGASIGTSGSFALPNTIYIDAGSVTLNGGTANGAGVRIGSGSNAVAGGNIEVHTAGAIDLNGATQSAAFRTQGNVWLDAASINQVGNGFVAADRLTVTTIGATNLAGPNQVNRFDATSGGALTLRDAGSLQVLGITTTNAPITLTTDSLINSGVIANGGDPSALVILNANAFNLAGGEIQAGAAAVAVRPRNPTNLFGIESAGQTTLTNADLDKIYTDNFIILGSGQGSFTGSMIIGQNARVDGGDKNLAFLGSGTGTITIGTRGVTTGGDVIVSAGPGAIVSNGGTVAGDEVQLRATQGIGASLARVNTDANALTVGTSGSAFVTEANDVTLRTIVLNVNGNTALNTTNTSTGGALELTTGGAVEVAGTVTSGGAMNLNVGGALNVTGYGTQDAVLRSNGGGQTITARSVNLTAADSRRAHIENFGGNQSVTATAGGMNLQVPSAAGVAQITNTGGDQTITMVGPLNVLGGAISPTFRNSGIFNNGGGMQTVSAAGITLQGASSGTSAGALISSQGSQLIDVTGRNITLRGGDGGANNHAQITAGAAGTQTIYAHDISLSNGSGGNDVVAVITGGHQTIDVTGTVTLSADGAIASGVPGSTGVRIGAPGGGNPTDLKLFVDGDLILNGGSVANNGVGIGSSSAGAAEANVIEIEVGRSLILNGGSHHGTNARIGSSAQNGLADGIITIKAGSIELNGGSIQPGVENSAAIRTQGSVTLTAGTISESGNGLIIAESLTTTTTSGATTLTGPNEVQRYSATSAGDLNLNNTVALEILSLTAPNATVTNAGSMTVSGFWNSTAATSITTIGSGSDLNVHSFVQSFGPMTLAIDGALRVDPIGIQDASLTSFGGQQISARSIDVVSRDGRFGSIGNNNAGDQTIIVSGGGINVDSLSGNGFALLTNFGPGNQTITALDGSGVRVRSFSSAGGAQVNNFGGGSQTITVERGGVVEVASFTAGTGRANITNGGLGNQTIAVTGGTGVQVLSEGGFATIDNFGGGDQVITVTGAGLGLRSAAGGLDAIIANHLSGEQRITVSDGSGIDIESRGRSAGIGQNAQGFAQTIGVTDGDHISLNGLAGGAFISANRGTQVISITGNGANAITLGSAGANGSSQIGGGSTQNLTAGVEAERGSISVTGPNRNGAAASIVSQAIAGGTQTVSTTGLLSVSGGSAESQNNPAGIFHNGSGLQNISAAGLELRGGTSGNGNGAIIGSNGGGNLANAGDQRLDISGDLVIAAGNGGDALINGGGLGKRQTIYARNIEMSNGTGGTNSFAAIRGGSQEIHASGDVRLTARSTAGADGGVRIGSRTPNPADVKLFVGRDLVLTGGSRADNNANIGSSGASGAVSNTIYIEAGGNVILNSGTGAGARIGTGVPVGTGSIEVHAGGDIQLNGVDQVTAIRAGTVTLSAASISEGARGLIAAGTLNTTTRGDALLTGPNQVSSFTAASESGNVSLTNTSGLLTLGSMNLPGTLSVIQTGDVAIGAANAQNATFVYASGDISVDASGAIVVRGSDTTAGAASAVVSDGTLDFNAGNVSLIGGGALAAPVLVRGDLVEMQLAGRLNVTGGSGHLSPAVLSSGSDFNLEIGDSVRVTAGSGLLSLARIQTEIKDGVINIHFPELSAGGYFVNGVEGREHHGQTGFFTLHKPAKEGGSLLLTYGD